MVSSLSEQRSIKNTFDTVGRGHCSQCIVLLRNDVERIQSLALVVRVGCCRRWQPSMILWLFLPLIHRCQALRHDGLALNDSLRRRSGLRTQKNSPFMLQIELFVTQRRNRCLMLFLWQERQSLISDFSFIPVFSHFKLFFNGFIISLYLNQNQ